MWTWLTSPPALLVGLVVYLAILQVLWPLTRKIVLFPRFKAEQQLGHALVPVVRAFLEGKRAQPPEGEDWSKYKA